MPNKRTVYQLDSLAASYEYRLIQLESEVIETLKELINESEYQEPHASNKAIKVNVFNYQDLIILNGDLIFLDAEGYHYSLFSECTLTDLIEIIKQQSKNL